MNAIKNGEEETDNALTVKPQHQGRRNTTWNKWNLSLKIHAALHARQLLRKSETLKQMFTVSSPTAWGNEKFVPSGFHTSSMMTSAMLVLLAITHLRHWRYEGNAFVKHILILWLMDALLDPQLKRMNAEWCDRTSLKKKISQNSQGALKVMRIMFFSQNGLVLGHLMPTGMMVNGHYYFTLLQDKVKS